MDGNLHRADARTDSSSAPALAASIPTACVTFASSSPPWARATDRDGSRRNGCRRAPPGRPRRTGSWRRSPCRLHPSGATLNYVTVTVFRVTSLNDQSLRLRRNCACRGIRRPRSRARPFGRDLYAGQKVFLISPRRYGKSSLVRQALMSAAKSGALTVEVQVSSYSSYVSFLEGYARALASAETRLDRARSWLSEMLSGVRPEVRIEPDEAGRARSPSPSPPSEPTATSRISRNRSSRCQARSPRPGVAHGDCPRRAPGHRAFNGGSVEHALRAAVQ